MARKTGTTGGRKALALGAIIAAGLAIAATAVAQHTVRKTEYFEIGSVGRVTASGKGESCKAVSGNNEELAANAARSDAHNKALEICHIRPGQCDAVCKGKGFQKGESDLKSQAYSNLKTSKSDKQCAPLAYLWTATVDVAGTCACRCETVLPQ